MGSVLVIDDDDQIRTALRLMLERAGYRVLEASDGKDGVKRYRESPADLVITDLIMPGKEGIETIIELKREFPAVKIFAISGGGKLAPEEHLYYARQLEVQKTFAKPFEREELLQAVREIIP